MRAGLVANASEYEWSSAAAHVNGTDTSGILDMEWWRREALRNWSERLKIEEPEVTTRIRSCTYAGRPFGTEAFVSRLGEIFGRKWTRGRPRKKEPTSVRSDQSMNQFSLF